MKLLLLPQQLLIQLLTATLQSVHHGLQLVDHFRQRMGLLLQRLEGLLALMGQGQGAKHRGNARVQLAGHLHPFTTADGRDQAQHRGRGHTGHRSAERQAQAFDGGGQGRANGLQIG